MTDNAAYMPGYSIGEEACNIVSHAVGTCLGVFATIVMAVASIAQGDLLKLSASLIFGSTLVLLYLMSTLYHGAVNPKKREILRVFDHCSIFVLIAGTYTPFTMISLRDTVGGWLGTAIWVTAILGIILNIISIEKFKRLSMICYIGMGWAIILTAKDLLLTVDFNAIILMVIGGIFYTAGTIFYKKRSEYMHFVWHLFVIAGSVFHFMAIYNYIILA